MHCCKHPRNKQITFNTALQELQKEKKPIRVLLEFNKRFELLNPVIPQDFETLKDGLPKLFYTRNSFYLLPERVFNKPTGIKRLSVFDPEQNMSENLHLNRYHAVQDLGYSHFLYSKKKTKALIADKNQDSKNTTPISVPEEISKLAEAYLEQYYRSGFPYPKFNAFEKMQTILELKGQNSVLENNRLKKESHGLSLLWSYFPHAWEIPCNNRKTVIELFKDKDLFLFLLKENLQKKSKLSESEIRGMLKTSMGVQAVSNFRPLAAKALYDTFAGGGVVYDMCAGFGGRLLGAILSSKVKKYIGVEPSTKTFAGLIEIKQEFGQEKEIELICGCAEEVIIPAETVDFCFTSPPYFNCEVYTKEPTQSCMRYKTKEDWIEGFFRKMITTCYTALKPEGFLAINIANVSSFRNLTEVANKIILQQGFKSHSTIEYTMSSFGKKGSKFEPIFIYKKGNFLK